MKKMYWLYRLKLSTTRQRQSPSFVLGAELSDYIQAWLLTIDDVSIDERRYTKEVAPWVKNKARFMVVEYNDQVVSPSHIAMMQNKLVNDFYAEFFDTPEEAKTRLRNNTDLVEESDWLFVTQDEENTGAETIKKRTLLID